MNKIDIKNCRIFVISNQSNEKYYQKYLNCHRNLIENGFNEKMIKLFNFIDHPNNLISLALSVIQIFEINLEYNFEPFIILEDDCILNEYYHDKYITVNIENDVDAVYLGISKNNANDKHLHYDFSNRMKLREIDDIYIQIFNMLSGHAILYCTRDYVKYMYKYLNDIYGKFKNTDKHLEEECIFNYDIFLAKSQSLNKVYAYKEPIFYQNDFNSALTNFNITQCENYNTYICNNENIDNYEQLGDIKYFNTYPYTKFSVTFVTCYFTNNKQQGQDIVYVKNLLENLHQPLIIFTDRNSHKKLQKMRGYLMNKTEIICCNENIQDKIHYINTVNQTYHFNSEYIIWIDIDFIQDKNLNVFLRSYPDIQKIKTQITDKIGILKINLSEYDNNLTETVISTKMIIYNTKVINTILPIYEKISNETKYSEDKIYEQCIKEYNQYFECIKIDNNNKFNFYQRDVFLYMFNNLIPYKPVYSIIISGGLCNQLYEILMAYTFCQRNDCYFLIDKSKIQINPHSNHNYIDTIYKYLSVYSNIKFNHIMNEQFHNCMTYIPFKKYNDIDDVLFRGHFQNEEYFKENIKFIDEIFDFSLYQNTIPLYENSIFLHIRLGDYVNHYLHDLKLNNYYTKAIDYFIQKYPDININIKVFSNDISKAKTYDCIKKFDMKHFEFIDEKNEIKSLIMMSKCHLGGIGSNSSFSVFANILNRSKDKLLILPNKWFTNDWNTDGIYPKSNCLKIDI